jgi:hypothetical protein
MKAMALGEFEQDGDITEKFIEKSEVLKRKLDETTNLYEKKLKDLIDLNN